MKTKGVPAMPWQVTTLHEHTNYQNGINMHLDWVHRNS